MENRRRSLRIKEEKKRLSEWLIRASFYLGYQVGQSYENTGVVNFLTAAIYYVAFYWRINSSGSVFLHLCSADSDRFDAALFGLHMGNTDVFEYDSMCSTDTIADCYQMDEGLVKRFFPGAKGLNTWTHCYIGESYWCRRAKENGLLSICYPVGTVYMCKDCQEDMHKRQSGMNTSGFIYLIGNKQAGYFKIGLSKEPKNRLNEFKKQVPFPIEIIHQIDTDDMQVAENLLHSKYMSKHSNGEWYALSEEDVTCICHLRHFADGNFIPAVE